MESGKILKESKIPITTEGVSAIFKSYKQLFPSTGKTYFILKERFIYELRGNSLEFKEVTESLFKSHDELSAGIASAEFISETYGEGFIVMTNLGKEYYYCPGVDRLYTKDEFFKQAYGMQTLLPGATDQTYYAFTNESRNYPDEKLQLLRFTYKYNNGGPRSKILYPSWHTSYRYTPYRKILIEDEDRPRLLSWEDLTPDRLYFEPEILYSDNNNVLINFKPTLSPDVPFNMQLLDVNGKLIWSVPLDMKTSGLRKGTGFQADRYFYVQADSQTFIRVNKADGKDMKTLSIQYGYPVQ